MDKFVNYKDAPFADEVSCNVEYEPICGGEGKVAGWRPKIEVINAEEEKPKNENVRGKRANVVFIDYIPICGGRGNTKIVGGFYYAKPVEKRGLYDLYVDNHMDIPESISKDSPCYRQFMKEKENVE